MDPSDISTRTQQPIVTGTTVLGMKYKGGVMLAADTLASYGTMARYKDVRRIFKVGDNCLIAASGEISDYQALQHILEDVHQTDINHDDGCVRTPKEIHNYLRAMLYQRRNKGNPLWNQLLVAGYNGKGNSSDDSAYLGYVDLIGTMYEEDFVATGFGAHLALPLIREKWTPDMEEGEARALLEDCLKVCYYRDCKAFYRIQIAKATADGELVVSDPYELQTEWETANFDVRHPHNGSDGSSW
jgi:20S proteasome subunit beta 7